jgi:hypothetical protein
MPYGNADKPACITREKQAPSFLSVLDIHGYVHQDIIYENDQQDATV